MLDPALSLPIARGIRTNGESPAGEGPPVWPGAGAYGIWRGS